MAVDLKFDVNVKTSKVGSLFITNCYLNLTVDNIDATTLINKFGFRRNPKGGLFLSIKLNNLDNYIEGTEFKKAFDYLQGTGKYIMPDLTIFKDIIKQSKYDKATSEMKTKQADAVDTLYEDIVNKINSPEIQKFLKDVGKIQLYDIETSKIVGWRLSPSNAARACAMKPNATFVATRKQWLAWNRMLIGAPTPIVLYRKSASGNPAHDTVKAELGINAADVKDSIQQRRALEILADAKSDDSGAGYSPYVVFDVSDTELIPGKPDLWENQRGLENNLTGDLNQVAKGEMYDLNINGDSNQESNDKNTNFSKKFLNFLNVVNFESDIKKNIENILKQPKINDIAIHDALKSYFDFVYRRNPDMKSRTAEREASIAVVLNSMDIAPDVLKTILARYQDDVLKYLLEKKTLSMIVIDSMKVINGIRHSLSEGPNITTAQDVLELFGIDPSLLDKAELGKPINTITEVYEKFNNILERMNN